MKILVAVVLTVSLAAQASGPAPASEKPPAFALDSPVECRVDGRDVTLPAGLLLPRVTVAAIDAEMKRLQKAELDLKAQNENLGTVLAERPSGIGLKGLLIAIGVGAAIGAGTVLVVQGAASGK